MSTQLPKDAFREGFIHAMREVERLRRMGFGRLDEAVNILEMHAGRGLKAWSLERGAAYESKAPKAWTGSTWWEIREMVLARDGRRCVNCGSAEELHIDHIHPVAKGGLPTLENLQVLCKTCNLQKGAGKLPAKNYGHTLHGATCGTRVAPVTATHTTTPLGVWRVAGSVCDRGGCNCKFPQAEPTCNFLQAIGEEALSRNGPAFPHHEETEGITRTREILRPYHHRRNATP